MEKPSKFGQWQEKSSQQRYVTRNLSTTEIEELRRNFVAMYECADRDITYKFQRITNDLDIDMDSCLLLSYYYQTLVDSKPTNRMIYSIKVPIPDHVMKTLQNMGAINRNAGEPPVSSTTAFDRANEVLKARQQAKKHQKK